MAYQREPMTCRCKRIVRQEGNLFGRDWYDNKTKLNWGVITCPDCNSQCLKSGSVVHVSHVSVISTPYRERDFYSRLTGPRADRIIFDDMLKPHKYDGWKASDALNDMLNTYITQKETSVKMLSVEECKQKLNEAVKNKVIRKWKTFSNCRSDLWHPYGIEITYTDGATRSFTGGTNAHAHNQAVEYVAFITPKEKKVNRYSYDECFRIMRKAKKEGIIRGWGFCRNNSNVEPQPATWVEHDGLFDTKRFTDDGTKGDIGVLNEVVAYVNQLSKEHALKNAKPATKDMTVAQLNREIIDNGYVLKSDIYNMSGDVYVSSLFKKTKYIMACKLDESTKAFMQRCVDHIRKQK